MTTASKGPGSDDISNDTSVHDPVGAPPLLPTENPAEFQAFHQRIIQVIKPADFIEELWALAFTKHYWHEMRLERLKIQFLQSSEHLGVEKIIEHHVDFLHRQNFIKSWVERKPEVRSIVQDILALAGLSEEAITAHTYMKKLEEFERIEKQIENVAARRNRVLHEIELRRELFARRLQEAAEAEKTRLLTSPDPELLEAAE